MAGLDLIYCELNELGSGLCMTGHFRGWKIRGIGDVRQKKVFFL